MSIPPLVCNSPPPPDQCEDDKEPEDYDFQYNSHPDDDEDSASYNFDNVSSNTIYKTQTGSIQDLKLNESLNIETESITPSSPLSETKTNSSVPPLSEESERNSDIQEECVLEDLNLELTTENLQINTEDNIEHPNVKAGDSSTLQIQDAGGTGADIDVIQVESLSQESSENDDLNVLDNLSADISFDLNDDQKLDEILPIDVKEEIEKVNEEIKATTSQFDDELNTVNDDDFGDFDSFQFTSTDNKPQPESIMNAENPWDNNIEEDFGDFTATFDNSEPVAKEMPQNYQDTSETKHVDDHADNCPEEDNDFGDFDDFKSSEKAEIASPSTDDVLPHSNVLDFPTSDNEVQIMENINKVLATIFTEDVQEPSETLDANLEKGLGEIWGHLVDTDIRQPYMVNWNDTLGQKSLLKALCIDSRNILFGTRWNHNMPKFAANLSASPLQPQKQPVQSNTENSEQSADKDSNAWVDPFTPHGQESCSPESENPTVEAKPNALEGFTGDLPASSSKIYSSALSVQPIRQINLPDTHIFTPTDSETPRSKTIHYDNTRTIGASFSAEADQSQKMETTHITSPEKDDYWDFQHFKGDTGTASVPNDTPKSTPNTTDENEKTFGTQILQPIKMEPVMPTLNWPDPGEVKETFMDFSDFVSSTTLSNGAQEPKRSVETPHKVPTQGADDTSKPEERSENDDDFETFQSAPARDHSIGFNSIPESSSSRISQLENLPTQIQNCKISDASRAGAKPSETPPSVDAYRADLPPQKLSSQILSPFPAQVSSLPVLQPSPASRGQQSSGQILQPLTLEGFSQINWPNPGVDLHDLSKFNPIESVHSLKSEGGAGGPSKAGTPVHAPRAEPDDDWGDFVSGAPQPPTPKRTPPFGDDDEWTDFVSSPSVKPNGLNTISFNVQSGLQKAGQAKYPSRAGQINMDIPTLNYITPKAAGRVYADKHFQNL